VATVLHALPSVSVTSVHTTEHHTHTSSSSSSDEGGGGGEAAAPAGGCNGDFDLGQQAVVNSRNPPGIACNNFNAPTNCPTGMYIRFLHQRSCYCVAHCDDYTNNPQPGQACTADGSWVCDHWQSRSTNNHSTFCAPAEWNLCRR
jgi:hypothetical protein